ncbi:MAG: M23 family metallopeptidase [Hespellia sp.]|nr:M23 family metallopeptidase [Hespellia sp.]
MGAAALLFVCAFLAADKISYLNGMAEEYHIRRSPWGQFLEQQQKHNLRQTSDRKWKETESGTVVNVGDASYIGSIEDLEKYGKQEENTYIKWVEFNVTSEAMKQAYQYDVDTYTEKMHLDWIQLLAVLGAKYGGDFTSYKPEDMTAVAKQLLSGEKEIEQYREELQYYNYYEEAYSAVLGGLVGEYKIQTGERKVWKSFYGLKAFNPIAKSFPYSDYDDFGVSRSYGYKRNHLGHDMMAQVGTPVIAVESGRVTALGWNQYGGWRIGLESFDGIRYYYYAHLRQNRPYAEGLKEGDIVQAGDVIGYVGRTGYSKEENVNNIDEYHLHFGLQLIFDESQRDGNNEIWVNGYELTRFLSGSRSEVERNDETKEWTRVYQMRDPAAKEGEVK